MQNMFLSEIFLILIRIQEEILQYRYLGLHVKVSVVIVIY